MNLRQLQYFLEIAQFQSFTRAAQVLHVAQPSLSRHIRLLEEELGKPLFTRYDRGVTLTDAGELLRDRASVLIQQFNQLKDDIIGSDEEPRGELSIGMPLSMREMVTVPLIEAYYRRYPRVTLHIREGISFDLSKMVQDGNLDCAVVVGLVTTAFTNTEPFLKEQMYLVGPPKEKFSLGKSVSMEYAANKPMILTSRPNSLRLVVENAFGNARLPLTLVADGNSTEMMIELVARRLAYSIQAYCATWGALRKGTLSAAPIKGLWIDWELIYPSHRGLSPASRTFKQLLFELTSERIKSKQWRGATLTGRL